MYVNYSCHYYRAIIALIIIIIIFFATIVQMYVLYWSLSDKRSCFALQSGMSALHLVAKDGNAAVATELLKAGIDPNAVTKVRLQSTISAN